MDYRSEKKKIEESRKMIGQAEGSLESLNTEYNCASAYLNTSIALTNVDIAMQLKEINDTLDKILKVIQYIQYK